MGMAIDPSDWNNIYMGGMTWLYRLGGAQDVGTPVQDSQGVWKELPSDGGDGAVALAGSDGVYYYSQDFVLANAMVGEIDGNVSDVDIASGIRNAIVSAGPLSTKTDIHGDYTIENVPGGNDASERRGRGLFSGSKDP